MVRVKVGVDEFGNKTGKASESVAKIAKETEKAQEAQRKWAEELAKMDFQKSMELIKQQTALMVANIEADTKKAVAAFESLNTGITSTFAAMQAAEQCRPSWYFSRSACEMRGRMYLPRMCASEMSRTRLW